jgi:5'-nucleotidase/2',3'-cyclic-nucleotide 2'-phosphodiesterase/3'-nucleotidase/5'-nucleotidase
VKSKAYYQKISRAMVYSLLVAALTTFPPAASAKSHFPHDIDPINSKEEQAVVHGQFPSPDKADPDAEKFELQIMHFNDTHSHLDNVAKMVTAVKEFRKENPYALLLDGGDVFSGTLYFNEFHGKADLEFLNLMGVDVMTFGNHEFDLGLSPEGHHALAEFIEGATFPFVSSNVDFSKDEKFTGLFTRKISAHPRRGHIYTGIVKKVKGERIGIFGLTTAETKDISSPEKVTFFNYIKEAKMMVAEFEKMGINKIIAISHIGYDDNPAIDNDQELAKAVEGIDIIVGGHSHTALTKPVLIQGKLEPTVIVQAGQYGEYLGTLNVTFDQNGHIVKQDGELIPIAKQADDLKAAKMLKKYSDKISKIKNMSVGATAAESLENPRTFGDSSKQSVRKNETPLGNVITDGMLAKAKQFDPEVIMSLQNGGGIRAPIDKGNITYGEVIEVLPFGFTLTTMRITGTELKQAFERSLESYPREESGFLQVSGAKVKFDSSKLIDHRVESIQYFDGKKFVPIQDDKMYTIATNSFTAKGGDGIDVFKKIYEEGRVTNLGLTDWEIFAEHLKKLGKVVPKVEGRIVDIAGASP